MTGFKVVMSQNPPDETILNDMAAQGWIMTQVIGPVQLWHPAGGLPGGLTQATFFTYFKRSV